MPHKIDHVEITQQGPKHSTNDDAYVAANDLSLYMVCDGVSGHAGGNVASALASETVLSEIRARLEIKPNPTIQEAAIMARDSIFRASMTVFEKANIDPTLTKMATTLDLVWQVGDHLLCAHTGDTRVYLWRRGRLQRLTKDHTFVQEMIDSGAMTEEQAKKSPYAHSLAHAIGIQATAKVDLLAPEIQEGDLVLVCSDGVYGGMSDQQIAMLMDQASGNLKAISQELIKGARAGGSLDDATAILLEIGPEESATLPPPLPLQTQTPPPLATSTSSSAAIKPPPLPGSQPVPLPQDKLNALDLSSCFGEMSFADKTRLLEIAKQRHLNAGDVLAREGEAADRIWVLVSGKVRVSDRGIVVDDRVGPLTLGEAALMYEEQRAATITVLEDAHVLEFDRARILAFFAPYMQNPAAQVYRAIAANEHKRLRELTHQFAEKSLPPRL